MSTPIVRSALALAAIAVAGSAAANGTIKDYLFAHNAGPVAANDIIGVSKTLVSDLQTPRDLALSLGSFGDRDTQNGFGIAITPARSDFGLVAISAGKYLEGGLLRRLWGGTVFSYAQNRKKFGSADFDQSALAVSASFMLHHDEDPIVIAYRALGDTSEAGPCRNGLQALESSELGVEEMQRRLVAEATEQLGRPPVLAELTAIATKASAQHAEALQKLAAVRACAHKLAADISNRWNASRFQLLLGRGWVRPDAGGGPRLRLATHVKISLAVGAGDHGLVNLSWRHAGDDLDTRTLAGVPAFRTTQSAGLRYTYRAGTAGDLYAIAEVSNVKASTVTVSQSDFKQALGIDKRIAPGLWLEFRYGRARSAIGASLESKTLFALKFSEDTTLDKQIR